VSSLSTAHRSAFALNQKPRFEIRRIGSEAQPLIVIDDVLAEPEALIERAKAASFARANTFYPGLCAPLANDYFQPILQALRPTLHQTFAIPVQAPLSHRSIFALVTDDESALAPLQKMPHIDGVDPFQIATVHYLCHRQTGGTAFFQHKTTGFQSIDAKRHETFVRIAGRELDEVRDSLTHYPDHRTPGFEMVDKVDIRFNRLILYPGNILHSGLLDGGDLDSNPALGRLTANTFINLG